MLASPAEAAQVHVAPGGGPFSIVIGIVIVIIGLWAIARPDTFRNAPRASLGPAHTVITRVIGIVFCIAGIGLFIFGVLH